MKGQKLKTRLITLAALVALLIPSDAHAIDATAPITASNGAIGCDTCTTGDANFNNKGILFAEDGTREIDSITPNASATKKFVTQANSAAPTLEVIVAGDLPSETSAQVATRVSDATGEGTGNLLVFNQGPTIDAATLTTSVALPADAVDAITEVKDTIKSGGSSATKILTTTNATLTEGHGVKIDANGNLVDAGAAPGVPIKAIIAATSETKIALGSTTAYMSIGGSVSTTEGDVRTPINAGTVGDLRCAASGTLGGSGIAVTAGVGSCTGSPATDYTDGLTVTVTGTTAASDTSDTMTVTAAQCVVLKLVPSSTTAAHFVNCSMSLSN